MSMHEKDTNRSLEKSRCQSSVLHRYGAVYQLPIFYFACHWSTALSNNYVSLICSVHLLYLTKPYLHHVNGMFYHFADHGGLCQSNTYGFKFYLWTWSLIFKVHLYNVRLYHRLYIIVFVSLFAA